MSIAINPEYRDGKAIKILWNAFKKKIKYLKKNKYYIYSILNDCISFDGIKLTLNNLNSKYVCDSHQGKIYESTLDKKRKRLKLKYVEINENNIRTAAKIQYEIFKDSNWCGYCDYLDEIKTENRLSKHYLPLNYLVYYKKQPIGIVGLYNYPKYKNDIFLNWLGVLPKFRNRGFGTQMLLHIFEVARNYQKYYFRVYTYKKLNIAANSIYKKMLQTEEYYLNEKENQEFIKYSEPKIFSWSFIDKQPKLWNNKFISQSSELELNQRSIKKLLEDKIITEQDLI